MSNTATEMVVFKSGGKASERKPPIHLFPIEAIEFGSERMGLGAATHGPENYMKGVDDEEFIQERRNHLAFHALNYAQGRTTVDKDGKIDTPLDHLKAVLANGAMLARIEKTRSERHQHDTTQPVLGVSESAA
jgi:hypothetical protein